MTIKNRKIYGFYVKIIMILGIFLLGCGLSTRAYAGVNSLTKSIEVYRGGAKVDNQYAVQSGDVIKTIINYNLSNELTVITDELFRVQNGLASSGGKCVPAVNISPSGMGTGDSDKVTFTVPAISGATTLSGTLSYECTVYTWPSETHNLLPEIMISSLKAEQSGGANIVYSGMSASEVILNYDPNPPLLGFDFENLTGGCSGFPAIFTSICFTLTSDIVASRMNSLTEINENFTGSATDYVKKYELAALLWPNTMVGDVYANRDLSNFALYGRNLSLSLYNSYINNPTWNVANYSLNPQAQSSYSQDQQTYYNNRIKVLRTEAQTISTLSGVTNWYLQTPGSNISTYQTGGNVYPEGKVWTYGTGSTNLTLSNTITYSGKGTLIVYGNLILANNAKVLPIAETNENLLGIIVTGNVTIQGNNKIEAPIFANGSITVSGNNATMIGSYVASDFVINNKSGVRFFYDYRLDSGWPPGFRYFNMPTAKNSAQ